MRGSRAFIVQLFLDRLEERDRIEIFAPSGRCFRRYQGIEAEDPNYPYGEGLRHRLVHYFLIPAYARHRPEAIQNSQVCLKIEVLESATKLVRKFEWQFLSSQSVPGV